ncbi:hypothetical protein, partial [Brevibacterium sanguinis]|uniref:hypothetical protein n=1 Tax=Brevibacterium sanguinis TaxID=232444 RepID=UPI0031D26DF0
MASAAGRREEKRNERDHRVAAKRTMSDVYVNLHRILTPGKRIPLKIATDDDKDSSRKPRCRAAALGTESGARPG